MGSTILLADDSLTIQKVVELTFSDTDHEVVAVSSGEELMQRLPDTRPDLVICDILMPGTDGYEVCQRIKSSPASLHIPVILLTGTFEPFDRDRALAAGCSEIITKPFEARKLVETVERLLAGDTAGPRAADVPAGGRVTAPSQFQGAVAPPPGDDGAFETRLSPPSPGDAAPAADDEDGLEFTATGFAEMEAAGSSHDEIVAPPPPADGLEFEPTGATADEGEFDDAFAAAASEGGFDQDTFDDDGLPAEDAFQEPPSEDEAVEVPVTAAAPAFEDPSAGEEPFSSNEVTADFAPRPAAEDEPFGDDAETAAEPAPFDDETETAAEPAPFDDDGRSGEDTWPEITTTAGDVGDAFAAADDEDEDEVAEPEIATVPLPVPTTEPEPEPDGEWDATGAPEPAAEAEVEVEDGADTAPIVEPPATPPAAAAAPPAAAATLSDEDVDRIARRVLELAADRIEQIAWDVVPDMAEIVVRERIRELEAAADDAEA